MILFEQLEHHLPRDQCHLFTCQLILYVAVYGISAMNRITLSDQVARVMLDNTPDGVLVCDDTGTIIYTNQHMLTLCGYTQNDMIGMSVETLVPTDMTRSHVVLRNRFFATNASRSMAPSRNILMQRKDGTTVSVAIALTLLNENDERLVAASVRDISELMEREHRLTMSNEALALAAERERIARDLHDNVLQYLFGLGLELQALEPAADHAYAARLAIGIDQIDRAIREIRTTVFSLGSASRSGSFGQELQVLLRQAQRLLGFAPRLIIDGAADLLISNHVQVELFAALREAIGNIARHAQATDVVVVIKVGANVAATVDDNGVGLAPAAQTAALTAGNGLANMRTRAGDLGGTFSIGPTPGAGRGTRLVWSVPL